MGGEWESVALEDVAREVTVGYVGSMTSEYAETGIPFLRSKNVDVLRINADDIRYISQGFHQKISKSSLSPGDVVIVRTGKPGTSAVIPDWLEEANCSDLVIVRCGPRVNNHFLAYYVNTVAASHVNAHLVGAVQQHFNVGSAKAMSISLPPLSDQEAIVGILGTLDDKIELNRQMNATLEAMAQALFKSWFVDFDPVIDNALAAGHPIPEPLQARASARAALGDARKPLPYAIQQQFPNRFVFNDEMGWVPEGWVISTFGRVSNCFDSKRIPLSKKQREEKKPGAIPYYGATSVMDHVNEWIFDDVYLLVGEDGSVVKQDGTPYVQYIWGRSWVNNHAHVLQGAAGISTEHLLLFISRANISAYVTGAVQPKINQKNLNSIPFLLATDRLNEEFDQIVKPYFERKRSLAVESDLLSEVRDTLLPKLLSGQLRVPEAERQVAEVL